MTRGPYQILLLGSWDDSGRLLRDLVTQRVADLGLDPNTVNFIDEHVLARPIEFNIAQISAHSKDGKDAIPAYKDQKALDGVTWTLHAYENGTISVYPVPLDAKKGKVAPAPSRPYYSRPFTSHLIGTVQAESAPKKKRG